MSVRTTAEDVQGIIEVDASIIPDDASMLPFITVANELVTEYCVGQGYTDARLELIERWLSAHFYTIRDMRAESEKAGPVSAKYQSKVDLGFDSSHYGQTAMRLDTQGGLSRLNKTIKDGNRVAVGVTWLGTSSDE